MQDSVIQFSDLSLNDSILSAHKRNTLNFIANVGTQSFVASIKTGSNKYKKLVKEGKFIASQSAWRGSLRVRDAIVFMLLNRKCGRISACSALIRAWASRTMLRRHSLDT